MAYDDWELLSALERRDDKGLILVLSARHPTDDWGERALLGNEHAYALSNYNGVWREMKEGENYSFALVDQMRVYDYGNKNWIDNGKLILELVDRSGKPDVYVYIHETWGPDKDSTGDFLRQHKSGGSGMVKTCCFQHETELDPLRTRLRELMQSVAALPEV